jgi:hypothetical protein
MSLLLSLRLILLQQITEGFFNQFIESALLANGENANLLGEAFIEAGPYLALTFGVGLLGHGANSIERV